MQTQNVELLKRRALAYLQLTDKDSTYSAVTDLGALIKLLPNTIQYYELRGNAYFNLGEIDVAINHYKSGLKMDPEDKGCKRGHKVVKGLKKKIDRSVEAEGVNDWGKAVTYLKEAWKLIEDWNADQEGRMSPEILVTLVLNKLVSALSKSNDFDEAIKVGEEAYRYEGARTKPSEKRDDDYDRNSPTLLALV